MHIKDLKILVYRLLSIPITKYLQKLGCVIFVTWVMCLFTPWTAEVIASMIWEWDANLPLVKSEPFNYRALNLWRCTVLTKEIFEYNIKHQVGYGTMIFFRLDTWIGEKPLAEMFHNLFVCAWDRNPMWLVTWTGLATKCSRALFSLRT